MTMGVSKEQIEVERNRMRDIIDNMTPSEFDNMLENCGINEIRHTGDIFLSGDAARDFIHNMFHSDEEYIRKRNEYLKSINDNTRVVNNNDGSFTVYCENLDLSFLEEESK